MGKGRHAGGQGRLTDGLSMVLTCCVVGCHNRGVRDKVSFFRIPSAPGPNDGAQAASLISERRQRWIAKINRKGWLPSKYSRVCSAHFISGISILVPRG